MSRKQKEIQYILGIETTCDETGLAIAKKEKGKRPKIIHNLVYSQEEIHKLTKGVVPEIAAREQVAKIFPLLDKLNKKFKLDRVDAIAVANRPGLVGSLLIGVNLAKTLSYVLNIPLIEVDHVVAHLYGSIISNKNQVKFPAIGLVISGGHTQIYHLINHQEMRLLGQSRDDAAGESFDKVAILLGLDYPGGPEIERVTKKPEKEEDEFSLPRPLINDKSYDFSFSGLKTAVLTETTRLDFSEKNIPYLAYEFQEAVAEVISEKVERAALEQPTKSVLVGGGVSANKRIRQKLEQKNLPNLMLPEMKYSTDNGAIIAARGSYLAENNQFTPWQELEILP